MTKMKKAASLLCIVAILIISTSLFGCESKTEKFSEYSFDYFDTVTSIVGYAKSEEEFKTVAKDVLTSLEEYHKLYTIYERYEGINNICTINALVNGEHQELTVDKRIIDLLKYAKEQYYKTDGKLNVAMGSVLSIWHEYREDALADPSNAKLPPKELLEEAAKHTSIEDLIINETASTVYLSNPKMTLDVGAIAKGYAVEMIVSALEARNVKGYVINVGGNVRTLGARADGTPWQVGIENPDKKSDKPYLEVLGLEGRSLVTSGSYQRYFTVENKNYHHIIDPETLMPSELYTSVSIVTKSSALGDVLSTALFSMSIEDGKALIASLKDTEAMWVKVSGETVYSKGFSEYISE